MKSLLKKELGDFLSSLIGYLVMSVFLCAVGLFMWVFPLDMNVLNGGYANMDALFVLGPWVFLFLAPAITMRLFAEEQRTGTLEILLTKPLTDWQIVISKFLAAWLLMLISIAPTLVYYYSVYALGSPEGNLDSGAIWGSYIGLVLLAGTYASMGLFASSLSENQIVSFIIAVFLCFAVFIGFDSISELVANGQAQFVLKQLGIFEHYTSISRGVVDSRDVIYFVSVMAVFLLLCRTRLQSRKW